MEDSNPLHYRDSDWVDLSIIGKHRVALGKTTSEAII